MIPATVPLAPAAEHTPLDKSAPVALVVLKVRRTAHGPLWTWQVVRCPYCGKSHTHGGHYLADPETGDPRRWLGGRVAHCLPKGDRGEYRLVEADPAATVALLERHAGSYARGDDR
jgi:hypothetical protein